MSVGDVHVGDFLAAVAAKGFELGEGRVLRADGRARTTFFTDGSPVGSCDSRLPVGRFGCLRIVG
jgi:hypothetical protein